MALAYPSIPYAAEISAATGQTDFLVLAMPVSASAGLPIAKDLPVFRPPGWRIVVVSLAAHACTFIGGAVVAQFFVGSHS